MTIKEFTKKIAKSLNTELPDCTIEPYDVIKNNDTIRHGVSFKSASSNFAPTIYLDDPFEDYKNGTKTYDEIISEIVKTYESHKDDVMPDVSSFTDWSWVKDRLYCKLINAKRNQEKLKNLPHRIYMDLAIIYNVKISEINDSIAYITVTKDHADAWGVDEQALYNAATSNIDEIMPWSCSRINNILMGMGVPLSDTENRDIYVLSTLDKINGAIVMTYNEKLKELSDSLNSDLYILPSSIYEVIAIPTSLADHNTDDLKTLIAEVNNTQVADEEILSYSLYKFVRNENKLEIVT